MADIKGSYKIYAGNYDWGCAIDQAVIHLEERISSVDAAALKVTEHKLVTVEDQPDFPVREAMISRTITEAYLCDEDGVRVSGPSDCFALKLAVSPVVGSPLVCRGVHGIFRWSDPYELIIEGPGMAIDRAFTARITAADAFVKGHYETSSGISYDYAAFTPAKESDLLLVWLHGLGEGQEEGSDAYLPLLGHKGTSLAGDALQETLGGAHILVPQCPTYWMDGDGRCTNFAGGTIAATSVSYYTESLEEMIDWYAAGIGAKKILLAGCSNGGFMTMVLSMHRPERYAAAVPVCEAVPDASITEAQIRQLVKIPIYFIYCIKDPVVPPQLHEIPTIKRLRDAGHPDLMVYESSQVVDTTGLYKNEDGSPYEYMSHLSWVHFDNDEDEYGRKLGVWEWMRQQLN